MSSSTCVLGLTLLACFSFSVAVQAQSITADTDPTGTVVNQTGNQYDITGGTNSGNNLYHSFQQFGLTAGEVANFITNPNTANILGRVTGGNASIIDGLLQVSGSNANLFLLNPSGILLGPNSALNLNGSFTATTASGIGVGDDWFNAVGDNSYAALVGNPNQLAFGTDSPAAVVNHGNLTVNAGESVTLIGGSVLNTGTITAPGGDITITAVPGQSLVNLAQDGLVISLDLPTADTFPSADLSGFSPLDLPALLTAGATANATDVAVNPDGTITLSGSSLNIPAEANTAIAAGTIDATSNSDGGTVQVLGEQVALLDGTIDVSGIDGGGEVLIGGGFQGNGTLPNAERTYVGETAAILADALNDGDGGRVIVWADNTTQFYGDITARGGATGGDGGFIEVSGAQSLDFQGDVDTAAPLGQVGTLLLDPTDITVQAAGANTTDINLVFADTPANAIIAPATISAAGSAIILQATNSINFAEAVSTSGQNLTAQTMGGNIVVNAPIATGGGNLVFQAGANIVGGSPITTAGGDISLTANAGDITTGIITSNTAATSGDISLTANAGNITTADLDSSVTTGTAGAISLTAGQLLQVTGNINSSSGTTPGDITLTHGGLLPFGLGSAGSSNGVTGSITSGAFTLDASNPNNPFAGSFNLGGTAPGNLDIIVQRRDGVEICPNDCEVDESDLTDLIDEEDEDNETDIYIDPEEQPEQIYVTVESTFTSQYVSDAEIAGLAEAQAVLERLESQTGQTPAVIFAVFGAGQSQGMAPLELLLVTADADPVYLRVPGTSRNQLLTIAHQLRRQVTNINRVGSDSYLNTAQTLYQWMVAPLEAELEAQGIDTLAFVTDAGLRSLPLAVLHDGEHFLIEHYNVGLMPSLSLVDTTYTDLRNAQVLVAGASEFVGQNPLPAAQIEMQVIQSLWPGAALQEENFTVAGLVAQRQQHPYGIVHLSTHGQFTPGAIENSYLQFSGERLPMDQIRELGWNNPTAELITLSACQTALGNPEAELGFAGFSVRAGVKSVLASLWLVSDVGTAGLMVEFYQQLKTAPIKAEALRQTQLAMIRGEVGIDGNQLRWSGGTVELPTILAVSGTEDFSHPFYWSGFTMVGSPW